MSFHGRHALLLALGKLFVLLVGSTCAFTPTNRALFRSPRSSSDSDVSRVCCFSSISALNGESLTGYGNVGAVDMFANFVDFLKIQQEAFIAEIERSVEDTSGARFGRESSWGLFAGEGVDESNTSVQNGGDGVGGGGGMTTRAMIQDESSIEKGSCSLTVVRDSVLTAERAAAIRDRQQHEQQQQQQYYQQQQYQPHDIQAGDTYSAAALSMVLHSRNPKVPTFRSDIRLLLVTNKVSGANWAWFGGGPPSKPNYLVTDDFSTASGLYQQLRTKHTLDASFSYDAMKKACDRHFLFTPQRRNTKDTNPHEPQHRRPYHWEPEGAWVNHAGGRTWL